MRTLNVHSKSTGSSVMIPFDNIAVISDRADGTGAWSKVYLKHGPIECWDVLEDVDYINEQRLENLVAEQNTSQS